MQAQREEGAVINWLSPHAYLQDPLWWEIYESSFPEEERDQKHHFSRALKYNNVKMGACYFQGKMIGIVVVYFMESLPFAFLHYFSIHPDFRRLGLGSLFFQKIMQDVELMLKKNHAEHLGMIWEIEDYSYANDDVEKNLKLSRLGFYIRNDAKLLNIKFIQPAILNCIVPMLLMHHHSDPMLNISAFEYDIAKAIYLEKYHSVNEIPKKTLLKLLKKTL